MEISLPPARERRRIRPFSPVHLACLGSWPLWMAPKNLNIRKVHSCGGVLKYKGPSGVPVSLSLVLASMFIQFACEISALAWSLEFLRTGYKLVVPPRTASGTDLWELPFLF